MKLAYALRRNIQRYRNLLQTNLTELKDSSSKSA